MATTNPAPNLVIGEAIVEVLNDAPLFESSIPMVVTRPKLFANSLAYKGYLALVHRLNNSTAYRSLFAYLKMERIAKNDYNVTLGFADPRWRARFRLYIVERKVILYRVSSKSDTFRTLVLEPAKPPTLGLRNLGGSSSFFTYRDDFTLTVGYEPPVFLGKVIVEATFVITDLALGNWQVKINTFVDPSILSAISSPSVGQLSLPGLGEETCPRIKIYYSTDLWEGNEMAQVLMQEVGQSTVSQYLRRFGDYVVSLVDEPCPSFMSKVLQIVDRDYTVEETGRVTEGIATYGLLRYFLWYLITGRWELAILKQSLTPMFEAALLSSKYACWNVYLQQPTLQEFAKYFIQ